MFDLDDDILIIIYHKGADAFFVVIDPTIFCEEIRIFSTIHVVFLGIFEKIIALFNLLHEFETSKRKFEDAELLTVFLFENKTQTIL